MTISAKIIASSVSPSGKRITTFELVYPRFILAELNTHRLLSRNSASSRACTVDASIKNIINDTAMPSHWGKNQPGMSADEECNQPILIERDDPDDNYYVTPEQAWNLARDEAILRAESFSKAGYHKQVVNRLLEPFTHMKTVLTGTEFDNFFWLRDDDAAQPEIHILAHKMKEAMDNNHPILLQYGDWHLPYYEDGFWCYNPDASVGDNKQSLHDAISISASCAAQVSYRKLDQSLEKASRIYDRLVNAFPPHFSPMEHQATPMDINPLWEHGVTHLDRDGNYWSGNFKGWIQNRQLMMERLRLAPMLSTPYARVG